MRTPIYIIDAFADKRMAGNPAGVCPLNNWLPDHVMQSIASEMNLSETVFFVPKAGGPEAAESCDFDVRWFTPTREIDLIGHATLAAGHLVLTKLLPSLDAVRFFSKSAELSVCCGEQMLFIDMPALDPKTIPEPTGLVDALGTKPSEILAAKHYLAVFDSVDEIINMRPNFDALAKLDLPAVIVSAQGYGEFDFVSRFFAPANGVPEDSVSGVAHCCLSPYWTRRLERSHTTGRQMSSRGGTVHCEYVGDRVILGGNCVITLEGTVFV